MVRGRHVKQSRAEMAKRKTANPAARTPTSVVKARIADAGKRALAEAQARRQAQTSAENMPPERGGQPGPEPTRYGDWEKKGIISDF